MIPVGHKDAIVSASINFMRVITEAYGTDEGHKLWDTIADTLDPDIKGYVLLALLTGEYNNVISISSHAPGANRVAMIKAIREVTGLGLKEAKDLSDQLASGQTIKLNCNPKLRVTHLAALRQAGFHV